MRKHVKPADPRATIRDPVRQRDLPPEGYPVEWSVHWIRLAARDDIVVTEIEGITPGAEAEEPDAASPAEETPGGAEAAPHSGA